MHHNMFQIISKGPNPKSTSPAARNCIRRQVSLISIASPARIELSTSVSRIRALKRISPGARIAYLHFVSISRYSACAEITIIDPISWIWKKAHKYAFFFCPICIGQIPAMGKIHKRNSKTLYLLLWVLLELFQFPKVCSITRNQVHSQSIRCILKASKLYSSMSYLSLHKNKVIFCSKQTQQGLKPTTILLKVLFGFYIIFISMVKYF